MQQLRRENFLTNGSFKAKNPAALCTLDNTFTIFLVTRRCECCI